MPTESTPVVKAHNSISRFIGFVAVSSSNMQLTRHPAQLVSSTSTMHTQLRVCCCTPGHALPRVKRRAATAKRVSRLPGLLQARNTTSSTMSPTSKQQDQQAVVDAALQAADALLASIKASGGQPSVGTASDLLLGFSSYHHHHNNNTGSSSSSSSSKSNMGFACDASGCVLTVVQQDRERWISGEAPFTHMLSGTNWSLGLPQSSAPYVSESFGTTATTSTQDDDSSSDSLHALVSGPHWRLLLSARELSEFVHMLSQLRMAVASLRFQGLWQAGGTDRPPSRAKWEGRAFKLTALYAPGEPGFSVHIVALCQADEYGPVGEREVSCCWPPDVTAAVVAELDRVLGLRPLAVRGT